jgi:hypothetical protein
MEGGPGRAMQMKTLTLLGALALFVLPTTAALAVPMCDPPQLDKARDANGKRVISMDDVIASLENRLRGAGIDAHNSRLWNGCLQTFVTVGGRDVMKFYDPDSLAELPAD